jgi:O-antigen ligase
LKLTKIILTLTGLSLFLIPLAYMKVFYNWYDFPKTMLLFVLGAILVFLSAIDNANNEQPGQMARFIFGYLVWLSLTVLLSRSPHVNFFGLYLRFQGLFFFIFSIFFFYLGRRFAKNRNYLIYPMVLAGSIAAIVAICEFWHGADRAGSTQGNAVLLANYLVLIIPCLLGLIFQASQKRVKAGSLLGFCIALLGLHFSFSRAGWAGLVFVIVLFCFFSWETVKRQRQLTAIVGLLLLISVFAVVILVRMQPGRVILKNPDRLEQIQQHPVVDQPRMAMIGLAWRVFLDHPVTGVGLNSLPVAATRYLPAWLVKNNPTLMWDQVHNDFFHTLATQGLGGGIFYLVLIILLIRRWLVWRRSEAREPLIAGIWAAVAGHLLLLQFSFPSSGYTLIFWVLIGILDGLTAPAINFTPGSNRGLVRNLKISAAFLLLVATCCFVTGYIRADLAYMAGQKNLEQKEYQKYEANLKLAIRYAPWEDHYRYKHAQNLYSILRNMPLAPAQRMKYNAWLIKELLILIDHNPEHFLYCNLIAATYEMYGMTELAAKNYREVIRLFPNYYPGYAKLGDLLFAAGRKTEALRYYRKALQIHPGYREVIMRLKKITINHDQGREHP